MDHVMQNDLIAADAVTKFLHLIQGICSCVYHSVKKRYPLFPGSVQEAGNINIHTDIVMRIIHALEKIKMRSSFPRIQIDDLQVKLPPIFCFYGCRLSSDCRFRQDQPKISAGYIWSLFPNSILLYSYSVALKKRPFCRTTSFATNGF